MKEKTLIGAIVVLAFCISGIANAEQSTSVDLPPEIGRKLVGLEELADEMFMNADCGSLRKGLSLKEEKLRAKKADPNFRTGVTQADVEKYQGRMDELECDE